VRVFKVFFYKNHKPKWHTSHAQSWIEQ